MTAPLRVGDAVANHRRTTFGVVQLVLPAEGPTPERGIVRFQNGAYATAWSELLRVLRDALALECAA